MSSFDLKAGVRRPLTPAETRTLHTCIEVARQRRYPYAVPDNVLKMLTKDFEDLPPAVALICHHIRRRCMGMADWRGTHLQFDPLAVFWWASLVRHPADAPLWGDLLLELTRVHGVQSILALVQHFEDGVPDGTMSLLRMLGRV